MTPSKPGGDAKEKDVLADVSQTDVQDEGAPARRNDAAFQRIAHALRISGIAPSRDLENLTRTVGACCPPEEPPKAKDDA